MQSQQFFFGEIFQDGERATQHQAPKAELAVDDTPAHESRVDDFFDNWGQFHLQFVEQVAIFSFGEHSVASLVIEDAVQGDGDRLLQEGVECCGEDNAANANREGVGDAPGEEEWDQRAGANSDGSPFEYF